MNFVKITAKSPSINLRLFVKENEVAKTLKEIRELHLKTDMTGNTSYRKVGGVYEWVDDNFLSVTMKRAIIKDYKARQLKNILSDLAIVNRSPLAAKIAA